MFNVATQGWFWVFCPLLLIHITLGSLACIFYSFCFIISAPNFYHIPYEEPVHCCIDGSSSRKGEELVSVCLNPSNDGVLVSHLTCKFLYLELDNVFSGNNDESQISGHNITVGAV